MSRFPSPRVLTHAVAISSLMLPGCMYQQPMYQPSPYGQQMYGAPGGYAQPGNIVIPPSNAPPYQPNSNTNTYDSNPKADDFKAEPNASGDQFFRGDGGVPSPKDSGTGTGTGDEQFNRDLPGL